VAEPLSVLEQGDHPSVLTMFNILLVIWCVLSLASLVGVWLFSLPRDVNHLVAARLATGAVVPGVVFQCELAMRYCSLRAGHRVVFAAYSMATLWPVSAGLLVGLVLAVASYVTLPPNTDAPLLEGIRSIGTAAWGLSVVFVALAIVSI
jgi:hypothetical protein